MSALLVLRVVALKLWPHGVFGEFGEPVELLVPQAAFQDPLRLHEALHRRHDAGILIKSLGTLLPLSSRLGRLLRASHHFGLEVQILIEDHFELIEGAIV